MKSQVQTLFVFLLVAADAGSQVENKIFYPGEHWEADGIDNCCRHCAIIFQAMGEGSIFRTLLSSCPMCESRVQTRAAGLQLSGLHYTCSACLCGLPLPPQCITGTHAWGISIVAPIVLLLKKGWSQESKFVCGCCIQMVFIVHLMGNLSLTACQKGFSNTGGGK